MNKKLPLLAGAVVLVLGAGSYMALHRDNGSAAPAGKDAPNIKQIVEDYTQRKASAKSASITSRELTVTGEDNQSVVYNLPADEFFVSVAPYIGKTHPCATHSLTGCQGELANESFEVHIEGTDGTTVLDQTMTSGPNGFIDLWLPRDQTYHVTIGHDGKEAKADISTTDKDDTCVTTMQLG